MSATHTLVHLVPLAKVDAEKVTPGVLGFIVFALIGLAVWGLMKSMNKQIKKVDFEEEPASGPAYRSGPSAAKPADGPDAKA